MERVEDMLESLDRQEWLERSSLSLQKAVQKLYESAGPAGIRVRDFLHGVWLGHPVHSVITDVPVGAYTVVAVLDLAEAANPRSGVGKGSDAALLVGITSAAGAAVAGLTDWQHTVERPRRVGFLHALLNSSALLLYLLSLFSRKRGDRASGRSLALGGYLLTMAAGYLGGHLAYGYRIGMNRSPTQGLPEKFTAVIDEADLVDEQPQRVFLDKIPLVLVRRGQRIYALAETCAHMGGPLAEGQLTPEEPSHALAAEENLGAADFSAGCIICPWHASQFSLIDGAVSQGPSVYPQPAFETRRRSGKIEVRVKANPNLEQG